VGLSRAPSPTIEPEELARIVESEDANEDEQSYGSKITGRQALMSFN